MLVYTPEEISGIACERRNNPFICSGRLQRGDCESMMDSGRVQQKAWMRQATSMTLTAHGTFYDEGRVLFARVCFMAEQVAEKTH